MHGTEVGCRVTLTPTQRAGTFSMLKVFFVILAYYAAFFGCLAWVLNQPSPLATAAITIAAVGGVPVIAAAVFHYAWRPMFASYLPVEPHPDAVYRSFQSFSIGLINMGLSINVAADDEYLHLTPLRLWRALGARPASVPWSALVKKGPRSAQFGSHRIIAPRWCIDLIEGDGP